MSFYELAHDRYAMRKLSEKFNLPENADGEAWIAKQNFKNTAENTYTG